MGRESHSFVYADTGEPEDREVPMRTLLLGLLCVSMAIASYAVSDVAVAGQGTGPTTTAARPDDAKAEKNDAKSGETSASEESGEAASEESDEAEGEPAVPPVPQAVRDAFNRRCVSCHGSPGAAGLSLSAGDLVASLVGTNSTQVDTVALVAPGDPERSYLVMKVRGDDGILGKVMPPGGKRLADETLAALVSWISGMAPEDADDREGEDADESGDAAADDDVVGASDVGDADAADEGDADDADDDADDASDRDADEGDEGEHGGEAGDTD